MTLADKSRPTPQARRDGHRGLCAGQERGAYGRKAAQIVGQRKSPRAVAEGDRCGARCRRPYSMSIPTAPRAACARPLREAHGLNPANIVCSNGSDEILGLLAQTYLSPGDEAIFTKHAFAVYKIYTQAAGGVPVIVRGARRTGRCRRHSRRGDAADEDRLSRQPQQSDRHLPAVRRGPTPARRPAPQCAVRAGRRLCGIRPAQRLRGRR